MGKSFLDVHQTVGYQPEAQVLVVTLPSNMANQMTKDGWDIGFDPEIGHFINITKE